MTAFSSVIQLNHIRDFCDEVQLLVRARLPLENHLAKAGAGHSQTLERLTQEISEQLEKGESLSSTISRHQPGTPRMLAMAVAAGVRTGRLADTLELLGDVAEQIIEARRNLVRSVAYPITIIVVAAGLFLLFISKFLNQVRTLFGEKELAGTFLTSCLQFNHDYWWWPFLVPAGLLLLVTYWMISGRAASLEFRGPERVLLLLPGVRGLVRNLNFHSLCRTLSLLVQREVPLSEAILLSAACVSDRKLQQACQTASDQLVKGDEISTITQWKPGMLPPLLQACLRNFKASEKQLQVRLQGVAGYYRRRLQMYVFWMNNVLPTASFFLFGGGAVLLYSASVFWPIAELFRALAPM